MKNISYLKKYKRKKPKFSKKMINKAIKHYYENGSKAIMLFLQIYSTYLAVEQKAAIVKDIVCNSKKAVTKFAKEYNVSRTSLYNWSKSLLGTANMRKKKATILKEDKYFEIKAKIEKIFKNNYKSFGYRRIKAKLKEELSILLSEKVIKRFN